MQIEYENSDILIIDKPAGLPVYSSKNNSGEESVLSWALQYFPQIKSVGDAERSGIVHRLDKQTSGLLVLAKNQNAFDYLKKLFKSRDISKEYLSLVYGTVPKHGVIDKPLTKIGFEGQSRVRVDETGKASVTEYWSLEHFTLTLPSPVKGEEGFPSPLARLVPRSERAGEGGPTRIGPDEGSPVDTFTLVKVKLHTGRTHQIRVHFASEKHPVMGDNLYGKPESQKLVDILPHQFLHASRLEFKLLDGTWLEVESKLPNDLQTALDKLSTLHF